MNLDILILELLFFFQENEPVFLVRTKIVQNIDKSGKGRVKVDKNLLNVLHSASEIGQKDLLSSAESSSESGSDWGVLKRKRVPERKHFVLTSQLVNNYGKIEYDHGKLRSTRMPRRPRPEMMENPTSSSVGSVLTSRSLNMTFA